MLASSSSLSLSNMGLSFSVVFSRRALAGFMYALMLLISLPPAVLSFVHCEDSKVPTGYLLLAYEPWTT